MKSYTRDAKLFYKSKQWHECRSAYLSHVGGLCERCFKEGMIVPAKIVHHKCYIDGENINNPSVTLSFDNLEALCQECHNREHLGNKKRYGINVDGELIF